ncbi:hypothetical protein HUT16_06210 [Kitasatospora sp. NA04385]|uniref:hypothetical protein n=1 Tax=Kitasatospora sp. NA04385 TaxID=2742135 RepID=UPI001590DC63|nr:hypothetical protein [Kitasatospora sp. NA04385]QKW18707.1 hypothetical protein HUT16_06210 [Kitasatospora sp. NA04385]
MPKRRKPAKLPAEPLEADRGSYVLPPVAARGFADVDGRRWRLARGPLDPRRAKRLAVEADVMSMGVHYDESADRWIPRFLPEAERPGAWLEARAGYAVDGLPSYLAYEFTAEDGRVLLFVETFC